MSANVIGLTRPSVVKALSAGAVAGLGGGLVFGMMMGMMGTLPMIARLVQQDNALAGFGVHMLISAFIGAVYGTVAIRLHPGWVTAVIAGMVNGIVWWILGALVLMPLLLGMSQMVLVVDTPQWLSLMGHLIYGIVTAILFVPLSRLL